MLSQRENPAAQVDAGRAQGNLRLETNSPERTRSPFETQLAFLARRGLSPTRAAIIAPFAFEGGRNDRG